MNKKILLIFILFFILFFDSNVNAAACKCGSKFGGVVVPKQLEIDGEWQNAYCADSRYHVKCSDSKSAYSYYSKWKSSTNCKYGNATGLDCSIMAGFVIKGAREAVHNVISDSDANKSKKKFLFAQRAVQTYLYLYSTDWQGKNKSYANIRAGDGKGDRISTVIANAYKAYTDYKNAVTNVSVPNLGVDITVAGGDNGMYYYPKNGAYYTYKITVNISGMTGDFAKKLNNLQVYVDTGDPNVKICSSNESVCNYNDALSSLNFSGVSNSFYLVTPNSKIKPNLTVTAQYTSAATGSTVKYYDTDMYRTGNSAYQKLLILEKEDGKPESKVVSASKDYEFVPVPVLANKCSNDNDNGLYQGWNEAEDTNKSIVCKDNNDPTKIIPDSESDKYTAKFKSCKMDNNKKIEFYYLSGGVCTPGEATTSIAIGQEGEFVFGGINGDTQPSITKGQGFYLLDSNVYNVGVSWKKAIAYYSDASKIYFYLDNSESVHHTTTVYPNNTCSSAEGDKFDDYANAKVSRISIVDTTKDFSKIFETYVNDSKKTESVLNNVSIETKTSSNNPDDNINNLPEGVLGIITYKFSTPTAYFNNNSEVFYGDSFSGSENYNIAGNRYYTLLKYDKDTYPFNLSKKTKTNFSLINGINWYLDGECSFTTDCPELYVPNSDGTYSLNVSYRSISVTNPFPKGPAKNWEEFEQSSVKMSRLAKTFDNGIYYSIDFEGGNVSKIDKFNVSNYSLFNNIDKDGKSKIVTSENGFKLSTNVINSYCPLGYFDDSCDK